MARGHHACASALQDTRSGFVPGEDESHEVGTRGDPGLLEHLAQVVVDRSLAEEELRGDLAVGGTLADGQRDA
jgi:hypothetical protein